jgi:hypothetical protein
MPVLTAAATWAAVSDPLNLSEAISTVGTAVAVSPGGRWR